MASYENARHISILSGEDLTGDIYKFGVVDNTGRVVVNTTAQGVVDCIINDEVDAAGLVVKCQVPDGGRAKVLAGGVIAAGGLVASSNAGLAVALGAANGNVAVGRYLGSSACASGDVIEIQFVHKGQVNA